MPPESTAAFLQDRIMDFQSVQADFPIRRRMVYLNNASIGPLSNRVHRAINELLDDVRDNGRIHYPQWCKRADTVVKADIARLIGAEASEIAFIKNTTEGLVFVANGIDWRPGDNVVVAEIEYPSNVYCWMNLARRGVTIRWVKARSGAIAVDDVAAAIDERTRVVSLSGVQFSNGFRLDLDRLCDVCQRKKVFLNLDMIQWIGALTLDLAAWPIDFLSAGSHKWLLGPIGSGFFYCRKSSMPHLHVSSVGYHTVDKSEDHLDYDLTPRPNAGRFEEALVNFPGIWGLHAAVETLLALGMTNVERHILGLNELAVEGLVRKGYEITSPRGEGERSGILTFRHPRLAPDEVETRLQAAKVQAAVRPGGVRISPSYYNDADEIRTFLEALPGA
jgi:cysteine desulfurase / selenocysteine lyase